MQPETYPPRHAWHLGVWYLIRFLGARRNIALSMVKAGARHERRRRHARRDPKRPLNDDRRPRWLVWLMAGILLAQDLGPVSLQEAPLELRVALFGFRLAILVALAQDLWGRSSLMLRLSPISPRLLGLCAAAGTLVLLAVAPTGAELLENGASGVVAILEAGVSVATAGALVLGLLRLVVRAWSGMRTREEPARRADEAPRAIR